MLRHRSVGAGRPQQRAGDGDEPADDRLSVGRLGDPTAVLDGVRTEFPELPFILYTGKCSEEVASEAISARDRLPPEGQRVGPPRRAVQHRSQRESGRTRRHPSRPDCRPATGQPSEDARGTGRRRACRPDDEPGVRQGGPGEAPTDSGITVPRRAVETALATVGADPSRETVSGGRADVADLFRAAWSDAAPARATLTVEGSGDGSVPEQTPQPPALGHPAELLEWDVQIREPTDDTVVYSPHGVGATAGTDEG